jgi:hypothetical protein
MCGLHLIWWRPKENKGLGKRDFRNLTVGAGTLTFCHKDYSYTTNSSGSSAHTVQVLGFLRLHSQFLIVTLCISVCLSIHLPIYLLQVLLL